MNKRKYIDDFNLCSRLALSGDVRESKVFLEFCELFVISPFVGVLFFWMLNHMGAVYDINVVAEELHSSLSDVDRALITLKARRMVEYIGGDYDDSILDITEKSLSYIRDTYCFNRLLINK